MGWGRSVVPGGGGGRHSDKDTVTATRWRAMTFRNTFALAAPGTRGFAVNFPPSPIRGRRECRMRAAPAVSRAKQVTKAHTSIQVQRRASDIPCAMALRLIRALLGDEFVLSPSLA